MSPGPPALWYVSSPSFSLPLTGPRPAPLPASCGHLTALSSSLLSPHRALQAKTEKLALREPLALL